MPLEGEVSMSEVVKFIRQITVARDSKKKRRRRTQLKEDEMVQATIESPLYLVRLRS